MIARSVPHLLRSHEELASMNAEGVPAFDAGDLDRHHPDAHWLLLDDGREIAARCSLWWRETPEYRGYKVGIVGHYAARNGDAGCQILEHACEQLSQWGCTLAVGPMDGSTWRSYRVITDRGTEPTFFLEPDHPDDCPDYFMAAGFTPLAGYSSALNEDLAAEDPRVPGAVKRLETAGIRVRPLDMNRLDEQLRRIYKLATLSFSRNVLYSPIPEAGFLDQYRGLAPVVQHELVLLAEQEKRLMGFLFAIPDVLEARRGENIRTVIVKTLAVLPGREYAGLGTVLVARCHAAARQLGYQRAIHALMLDGSASRNLSGHTARTIRRYTLFARPLTR